MRFWTGIIGYQLVWFAAVIGAAHGVAWPAIVGLLVYATCQSVMVRHYKAELLLTATAIALGVLVDGGLSRAGLAAYAVSSPSVAMAPAWILALWATFALTLNEPLRWLQTRLWLAAVLGAIGGPLAYLGASHGWHVVTFVDPAWRGLFLLGAGWALSTPALAWLARYLSIGSTTAQTSHLNGAR